MFGSRAIGREQETRNRLLAQNQIGRALGGEEDDQDWETVADSHDQRHRWVENRLDDYFSVIVFRKMVLIAELISGTMPARIRFNPLNAESLEVSVKKTLEFRTYI